MSSSIDTSAVQNNIGAQLENEIQSLRAQIASLKAQRSLQAATILSSRASISTLDRLRSASKPQPSQTDIPPDANPLLSASRAQISHNQENLYRLCAGVTTFRIRDPDPNAVDEGNVLGIRFDISTAGKFDRPYYMMLNKPWPQSQLLRIHRHTLPPYIPLAALAERYLSNGKGSIAVGSKASGVKKQDLRRFVREVRRAIVGYHNRTSIVKSLRKEFNIGEKQSRKGKGREKVIEDISAVDAEVRQLRIEWVDGRLGRAAIDEKGQVIKCVIIGEEGRDTENEGRVARGDMAGIGERLREGIY